MALGVEVPDAHGVVAGGGEEVVVLGVEHQRGDAVGVPLEHLDHPILVDRPVEHQVVLLGRHQHRAVVVRVAHLLDLVDLERELAVGLAVDGEVDVEGLRVGHVEDLSVVRKVHPHDVLRVLLYDLRRLHLLEQLRAQLHRLLRLHDIQLLQHRRIHTQGKNQYAHTYACKDQRKGDGSELAGFDEVETGVVRLSLWGTVGDAD